MVVVVGGKHGSEQLEPIELTCAAFSVVLPFLVLKLTVIFDPQSDVTVLSENTQELPFFRTQQTLNKKERLNGPVSLDKSYDQEIFTCYFAQSCAVCSAVCRGPEKIFCHLSLTR